MQAAVTTDDRRSDVAIQPAAASPQPRPLAGRIAVITGASRGIGRAIALTLAARGADVVVGYGRNEGLAVEVAEQAREHGVRAIPMQVNVADEQRINAFVREVRNRFDRIDILVSNAATGRLVPVMELDSKGFGYTFNVNTRPLLLLTQAVFPVMRRNGWGRILACSSPGSTRIIRHYSAVGATKAAMESLIRYIAAETAGNGITANVISASIVDTDAIDGFGDRDFMLEGMRSRTPEKRNPTPEDVAALAAFLCTDDAAMIQGQTIMIDGGYTLF